MTALSVDRLSMNKSCPFAFFSSSLIPVKLSLLANHFNWYCIDPSLYDQHVESAFGCSQAGNSIAGPFPWIPSTQSGAAAGARVIYSNT